jgi:predicted Fe-Mo cluster-binding NifX family protein
MKIAVASDDGVSIAQHFGRSAGFIIFELEGGKPLRRDVRPNSFTHAAVSGDCAEGEHHHAEHAHSHDTIVEALADCSAILCGGMGRRAAQDLAASGIQPVAVGAGVAPEEAVAAFLSGELASGGGFCGCGH